MQHLLVKSWLLESCLCSVLGYCPGKGSDYYALTTPDSSRLFPATLGSFENGGAMDSKAVRALQKFVDSLDVEWLLLGHEGAERG